MSITADYIKNAKPSAVATLATKVWDLQRQGVNIINMTIGELDFNTPDHIKQAGIRAIQENKTKYTPIDGVLELKKAIQKKYHDRYPADLDQIIVSSGAKHSLFNCFMATLNPNDEVIILAPYWTSYPDMVSIVGGKPIIVHGAEKNSLKVLPDQLSQAITKNTKWVLINSPNNPTGVRYGMAELKAFVEVLRPHKHVHILSDDIYEDLEYHQDVYSIVDFIGDMKDRLLVINGVSKSYAMTGWRIGYTLGAKEIIKAMALIQSQSTGGACSVSQWAALEAIAGDQSQIKHNIEILSQKLDLSFQLLMDIPGITCIKPNGAFYLFPNCTALLGLKSQDGTVITTDVDLCEFLLTHAKVATMPGSAFGAPGYMRISYATSEENIKNAFSQMKLAIKALHT